MKNFLVFLVISLWLISCSQKSSENIEWIPFTWTSVNLSGRNIEKVSMNIPVRIDDLPYKFTMQFDLGAVTTNFYGNSLNPFLEKYPLLNNKLDTTKTIWMQNKENPMFCNIDLQLGDVVFKKINVGLFTNYGDDYSLDSIDSETEIHIGTIASDLFQEKILIIDYKSNRLAVTDSLPSEYQRVSFESINIDNGRIKIPFRINGKIEYLMFDTGSSLFPLSTTKQNAIEIGSTEIVDSLTISSWGNLFTTYGLNTTVPIMFGNEIFESSIVYYEEEPIFDYFYENEKIWGLTGNAFFFNNIVIIDYKNNRFGVR